ncbi:MAG: hypothetical protein QOI13_2565, partial [Paraburkholderia sp.]|nr:hypothetical protein [Paraburkholderia sp.]
MTALNRFSSDPLNVSSGDRVVRERLLDAAEALVYAGGIHATGV